MTQNTDKRVYSNYITPAFRLSYPALFEPVNTALDGSTKLKYSVTMLFPKKLTYETLKAARHPAVQWMPDDNCQGLYAEICKIARANFGPEVDLKSLKLPKFRDGDKPKPVSGKIDDNDKGYIVLRATCNEKIRPDCLRQDKTRITDPGELYPGCWVRALVTIAPFVHKVGGRGVTMYLTGIQKLAEDNPFSSRSRVEDEFDAVAVDGVAANGSGAVATTEDMSFLKD